MRILQLCHKMPFPVYDGGSLSIYNMIRGLHIAGVDLKVLAVNPVRDPGDISKIPVEFVRQTAFEAVAVDTRLKVFDAAINLFQKDSYFVSRFRSDDFARHLAGILLRNKFDVIQLEHLYLCVYLDVIREHSRAKIVLRPQNVEYAVWQKYRGGVSNPLKRFFLGHALKRLEKFEKAAANSVDGIMAISPYDAALFRSMIKNIPVSAVPIGFDEKLPDKYDLQLQYKNFPSVYHLGSMDWWPNQQGIEWFVQEILPLIQKKMPQLPVHLAGKKMPARFFRTSFPNLHVQGLIDDSTKFQEYKSILMVPLLSGGGIRAKIIEAMFLGKTIITTSIGLRGIACEHGRHVLVADTPAQFADAITKAASSIELCKKLGREARNFARKNFSLSSCSKQAIVFYRSIIS